MKPPLSVALPVYAIDRKRTCNICAQFGGARNIAGKSDYANSILRSVDNFEDEVAACVPKMSLFSDSLVISR
ncbi:MAG: hypothetical protein Q4A71_06375 [Actinomycetaceae bacterium]|nr:hypothetical protein [Actinomycetaceae bacterium]